MKQSRPLARRARRLAALLVGLALAATAPSAAQVPTSVIEATRVATDAYNRKDWHEAIRLFEEQEAATRAALKAAPGNGDLLNLLPICIYNAACCAARAGLIDEAFARLDRAIDAGMLDRSYFATDTDLDLLRTESQRWAATLARLESEIRRLEGGAKQGVVIVPPRADRNAPIRGIVALHGGGGSVEDMEAMWRSIALEVNAVVILVRGNQIYGFQSFGYNQADAAAETGRITQWVAEAKRQVPGLDADHLILSGYSQGGGLAALFSVEGPGRWAGALLMAPYVQQAQRGRAMSGRRNRPPTFVIVGEHDEEAIREVGAALTDGAASPTPARLRTIDGAGHGLTGTHTRAAIEGIEWLWVEIDRAGREKLAAAVAANAAAAAGSASGAP